MMTFKEICSTLESKGYILKAANFCTLVYRDGKLKGTVAASGATGQEVLQVLAKAEVDLLTTGEQNAQRGAYKDSNALGV